MSQTNKMPETVTSTSYRISVAGESSHFSPNGYSKYFERFTAQNTGGLPEGEQIYGYAQALEHIQELRGVTFREKHSYADAVFEIRVITEVTTTIIVPKN